MECEQLLHRAADLHQRIRREAARFEPLEHAGLRIRRHPAHGAPGIGEEAERAAAVIFGSSWRTEPAAELRGFA